MVGAQLLCSYSVTGLCRQGMDPGLVHAHLSIVRLIDLKVPLWRSFCIIPFPVLTSAKNGWTQMPGFVDGICLFSVASCWLEPHLHVCIGFLFSLVSESVQWLVCWQMAFPLNKIQWLDVLNVPEGLWHLSSGQWKTPWHFLPSLNLPFICVLYRFLWGYGKKNIKMWLWQAKWQVKKAFSSA